MIKQIRTSKFSKVVACYLAIMMFVEMTQPMRMYALTSGPTQPEFNAFTPIATSDMVDLTSGDFNYNIPIMDVGGYPINLAYNSGVTMDQEASWVGLGWNLNVGQISRQVRGLPDDFRGDEIRYENSLKDNITIGSHFNLSPALLGNDSPFSIGLGVQFNNYEGITFKPSLGISYSIAGVGQVGCDLSGSVGEGATLTPSVSISGKSGVMSGQLGLSAGLNSRKGLETMSMSAAVSSKGVQKNVDKTTKAETFSNNDSSQSVGSMSGSLSFNNQSYTPTKRIAFMNKSKSFNATVGGEVFGVEGQVRINGYGSYQTIADGYKDRKVGAYGYENTQYKNGSEGVLDFNREKEQTITKNTNVLPVTNYTYDTYNIEGQGVSGMFRPYRSQVGYLYNDNVSDFSSSQSFGVELGLGNLVHGGVDFNTSPTRSTTGLWHNNNYALPLFKESNTDVNKPLYEQSTFKLVGELDVDNEGEIYELKLLKNKALRLQLEGGSFNRVALPKYQAKRITNLGSVAYDDLPVSSKIKRKGRILRNQTIQKISKTEAIADEDKFFFDNDNAKSHHTAGMKVLQADGTTYIYGKTAYNKTKVEATFDVSGRAGNNVTGLVTYNGSVTGNQGNHSDEYVNRVTTPGYAHSYLITSVLSPDYQDLDNNGPSDKDLGNYTKFEYVTPVTDYQWRVPYERNKASYSEGLKSSQKDQKGNYIYGIKEITYLNKIETKTHIAFIELVDRKDAMGVSGEAGGMNNNQAMKCIKSIRLYSKAEITDDNGNVVDPGVNGAVKPIKTAHFEYDYSLCKNIPSNSGAPESDENGNPINFGGKLTLKKVYFTYRGSNMGKYTPYKFDYEASNPASNPNYALKGFDIWGNYNPVTTTGATTTEYPFVNQESRLTKADIYTGAWTLKSITLPSGGKLKIETESDDYKYVQNKKAMQMFKVVGAGESSVPSVGGSQLYTGSGSGTHYRYLYVKVGGTTAMDSQAFINQYLSENSNKPIYFKFLMNMKNNYDYVSGYFEIDQGRLSQINVNNQGIAAIPMKLLPREGGVAGGGNVNPIAKAGWGFGRTYLNRVVYGTGGAESNFNFVSIVNDLVGSLASMAEIFTGPNLFLEMKGCAKNFTPDQSWIRLENPNGKKLGGGLRVKRIALSDNWDVMNSVTTNTAVYNEQYGQDYNYELDDERHTSSGVATYEPNASPENALVEPFYGTSDGNYAERIGSPRELNYAEKPFGETFFPSPKVTYSRVTVTNLNKNNDVANKVIKKHATGKVITEHYTSYDFPTIVNFTEIDARPDHVHSPIWKMLSVSSRDHFTASQGFSIETNDMNGKVKSERVYPEGENYPISRVDYKYNVDAAGRLNNVLTTIDSKGAINNNSLLGVEYDVINDFNESSSVTEAFGVHVNVAGFLVGFFPVFIPMPLPNQAYHETIMRTATTTKVIHKTGILQEKIAYDSGSVVSTKNLAWDAKSGQVLLTETINEFDDKYYSFNYPAYWNYENMGMASENIDLKGTLVANGSYFSFADLGNNTTVLTPYFKIGDELVFDDTAHTKLWVTGYNPYAKDHIQLINRNGNLISQANSNLPASLKFKVVRSGYKNQQTATMASITSMVNPLTLGTNITNDTFGYQPGASFNPRIIKASAVEYSDDWKSQCENDLPNEFGLINAIGTVVNPFLYNTKGNWRAIRSYAYLTGRNNFETSNRRKTGYFTKFSPFYKVNNGVWSPSVGPNYDGWTFASQITMYNPYGVELENKDALERYSSAQYGYQYKLPVAVASNAQYKEIGFDGFEDYHPLHLSTNNPLKPHFGFSNSFVDNAEVTNLKSHSGHNSIAILPGKKVAFTRKIDGCKDTIANSNKKHKIVKR
jgi:hypothetical protein